MVAGVTRQQIEVMAARAPIRAPRQPVARSTNVAVWTDAEIDSRARSYARTKDESISGCHGHNALMDAARDVYYGFDTAFSHALEILLTEFNPRCQPPWDERDIERKLLEVDKTEYSKPRGHLRDARPTSKISTMTTTSTAAASRPRIAIGADEHRVNDEATAALVGDKSLYQRGGELVRVVQAQAAKLKQMDRPSGPAIKSLSAATLREKLSAAARFIKIIGGEEDTREVPDHPPQWCVLAVKDRGEWPAVRNLEGVTDFPIVRPDGSVCSAPGYDEATEVYVGSWGGSLAVPEHPTQADAQAAAKELADVVVDFPFETASHRAAWVAAVLTPLARFAFDGPAPLMLIEANVPGAGKGRLAEAASLIITGTKFATAQYSHDSAEMRKCITSSAISGDRLILLDNVSGTFGNDAMDAVLTSSIWRGRVLGENREVTIPLRATWFATGNNITLVGDISRRILHILLHSPLENPEERSEFEHPDLAEWIHANRPRLLSAALTVLSAYIQAGCPRQDLSPFGSFEGWNRVVRSAVVWSGLEDPAQNRKTLREDGDSERQAVRCLLENWNLLDSKGDGLTVGGIIEPLSKPDRSASLADIADAVSTLAPGYCPRKLGAKLRKWKNRTCGNWKLSQTSLQRGSRRWKVVSAGGGCGGDGGCVPTSSPYRDTTQIQKQQLDLFSPASSENTATTATTATTSQVDGVPAVTDKHGSNGLPESNELIVVACSDPSAVGGRWIGRQFIPQTPNDKE